jgi:hypothetical protein
LRLIVEVGDSRLEHLGVPGQLGYLGPLRSWELAGGALNDLPQWPGADKPAHPES